MTSDRFAGNLAYAFGSQSVALIASFVMSFLVPKSLTVAEFGYWQLFIFYGSYVGFFLLGLNGGIYLLEGGKRKDQIDESAVGSQIFVGTVFQLITALSIGIIGFLSADSSDRGFVLVSVALLLLISNINDLFGYVFQATNETRIYSASIFIDKTIFLIFTVLFVFVVRTDDFRLFVLGFIGARTVAALYSAYMGRNYVRAKKLPMKAAISTALGSVRVGINLMLSSIATMFILGVARFIVDYLWGIETFGQFSLALSLVNFIMLFVSQVSMVLFPALRQTDNANLGRVFVVLRDGLDIFGPVALLLLTPVSILVAWWLPQYSATLEYFAVLLPICIFDGKMNLLGATYLKVLRQERALLKINVVSAIASSIAVLASAFIWHNIFLIMVSVCIVITARSLYTEWYVAKKIGITGSTIQYVPILTTFIYFVTSQLFPTVLSFVVVAAVYAFVLVYHRERIRTIFTSIRSGLLGR